MRIIITGGAGFIGSHLCERLLNEGWEVICCDNLITGRLKNIENLRHCESTSKGQQTKQSRFSFIKQNISERIDCKGDLDYVLHLASPASPVDYYKYPIQTLKVGSLGTHNALGLAKAKEAKFLLASTSEVYGDPQVHPQTESYWGNVNPIGPRSVYDEAKRFAEALTMAYHRMHGIDTRIARIFNTYGPRMRMDDGRVVPNFIMQALNGEPITVYGDGSQTRSFCYISDMVEGLCKLMLSSTNEPVNLGNPEEMSVLDFARLIKELTGSTSEIVFKELPDDDPKMRRPDITRAKEQLSWEPKTSVKDGLVHTIDWFKLQI